MSERTTERLQIGGALVASLALFYSAFSADSWLNALPFFLLGLVFNVTAITFAWSRGLEHGREEGRRG